MKEVTIVLLALQTKACIKFINLKMSETGHDILMNKFLQLNWWCILLWKTKVQDYSKKIFHYYKGDW